MIKSFINYPGGKYRLLSQILPLFPLAYDNFVDMFVGSAVVSANIPLDVPIFAYDLDRKLIELLKFVQRVPAEYIIMNVEKLIEKYNLSDTRANGYHFYGLDSANGVSSVNKPGFNLMRQDYNDGVLHHIDAEIYLYTLVVFGFNNTLLNDIPLYTYTLFSLADILMYPLSFVTHVLKVTLLMSHRF